VARTPTAVGLISRWGERGGGGSEFVKKNTTPNHQGTKGICGERSTGKNIPPHNAAQKKKKRSSGGENWPNESGRDRNNIKR